jgi:hypothetical protein
MTGNRSWDVSSTSCSEEGCVAGEKGKRKRRISNDPEVMQLVTKDLIRDLRYNYIGASRGERFVKFRFKLKYCFTYLDQRPGP